MCSAQPETDPSQALDRTIVLVGLMGAGKTTIGRRLSKRLGVTFVDADEEVERAAGRSISDIFESYGEKAFRDVERRVIERLLNEPPHVLATGGGAFMDPETRKQIKDRGISVWLYADVTTLAERVKRKDTRPLLRNGDPAQILRDLAKQRYPVYALADIRVESGGGPHDLVVTAILDSLEERA